MVVAGDEARDGGDVGRRLVELDQRGQQLAQQQRRAGAVAVVALVAHLQRLGGHRAQVDRLAEPLAARRANTRASTSRIQRQALEHLGVVGAVAQHLAEPLVERAERAVAVRGVLDDAHRHRRAHDAGHRPDRAALVARAELELAGGGHALGVLVVARRAPRRRRRRRSRRAAGRTCRPTRSAARRAAACGRSMPGSRSRATPTPTSSGCAASSRATASSLARAIAAASSGQPRAARRRRLGGRAPVDALDAARPGARARRRTARRRRWRPRAGRRAGSAHRAASRRRAARRQGVASRCCASPPRRPPRAAPAARRGPAGRRPRRTARRSPCASGLRAIAGASSAGRVGVRAVAEHDVEQHHATSGSRGLAAQALGAQRRVDHRVRAALGVARRRRSPRTCGRRSRARTPGATRAAAGCSTPPRPTRAGHDHHRLVAQRAAAVEPADVAARGAARERASNAGSAPPTSSAARAAASSSVRAYSTPGGGRWPAARGTRARPACRRRPPSATAPRDGRVRRLGDRDDHLGAVVGGEQLEPAPHHQPADLGAQVAPADADRVRDPDPRRVEQAAHLLRAGARRADDADRPALAPRWRSPSATPSMIAVPQSAPMNSSPRSSARRLSAAS